MGQVFTRAAAAWFRVALGAVAVVVAGAFAFAWAWVRSPWNTGVGVPIEQPVPFSHAHHVGGLGIDCRYCHGAVETSAYAGMPATETCMTCHAQVWTGAALLAPVHQSFASGTPLRWNRVYRLPDHVYFEHRAHVAAGVPCVTCHGRMDEMALTAVARPLEMRACIACHRHPERALVERAQEFSPAAVPAGDDTARARRLARAARLLPPAQLTTCSTCHR